jgi:hypothetical protein
MKKPRPTKAKPKPAKKPAPQIPRGGSDYALGNFGGGKLRDRGKK